MLIEFFYSNIEKYLLLVGFDDIVMAESKITPPVPKSQCFKIASDVIAIGSTTTYTPRIDTVRMRYVYCDLSHNDIDCAYSLGNLEAAGGRPYLVCEMTYQGKETAIELRERMLRIKCRAHWIHKKRRLLAHLQGHLCDRALHPCTR